MNCMTRGFSRHELYAHGEPFGDSCTRKKIDGKGYICGFGGKSNSNSTTTNTTTTEDNRVAVSSGVGISNSSGNTINVTDSGATSRALDTADFAIAAVNDSAKSSLAASGSAFDAALRAAQESSRSASEAAAAAAKQIADSSRYAMDFAGNQVGNALSMVDTTLGEGFARLLDVSSGMWERGDALLSRTQDTVANAYADAQNTAKGTIDNRTMIVLALAAAGSLVAIAYFRKR